MSKIIGYDYGSSFKTYQTTTTASTTSLSLTVMGSVLVPANTYVIGDVIRCYTFFDKVNVNGGYDVRLYRNTTNDLSGSPVLIGIVSATTTTAASYTLFRRIKVNALTGSSNSFVYSTALVTIFNDTQPVNIPLTQITIDWTQNNYIIAVARLTSSSDTINFRYLKVANG